jgi:hypothetical protein
MIGMQEGLAPPPQLRWLHALREPEVALNWSFGEWERVVRLARRLRLLGRLAEGLMGAGLIDQAPRQARRHLIAEQRLSRWRTAAMLWTLERLATMLGNTPYPRVLLKGGAYIGQDLPIAAGRLPSDLDILVPQAYVPDVQARLAKAGWKEVALDEHDRRYYYEWSHEVPPMRHPLFALELDLHHNILPPVARTHVDAGELLERLRPSMWSSWRVLDPLDQVLHSAAHLFHDSEVHDRIRDLVDLDGLLRHFGAEPGFVSRLPDRARQLGLEESLALACHFCVSWLGTPIPADVRKRIESIGPGRLRRAWMLPLLDTALMPTEPDDMPSFRQQFADLALLARYHRQRMPLRLLLPHLWHKIRASRGAGKAGASDAAPV